MLFNKLVPNSEKYLREPTEGYARVMETRFNAGINPGEKLGKETAQKIYQQGLNGEFKVDPKWFGLFKNEDSFRKLFNRLPSAAPIVGGSLLYNQTQSKKQGGNLSRKQDYKTQTLPFSR